MPSVSGDWSITSAKDGASREAQVLPFALCRENSVLVSWLTLLSSIDGRHSLYQEWVFNHIERFISHKAPHKVLSLHCFYMELACIWNDITENHLAVHYNICEDGMMSKAKIEIEF